MRGEARCAVTVPVPAHVVYGFWADLASYPRWLHGLDRVDVFDDRNSRWFTVAAGGRPLTWQTEVTMQRPAERWAWSSTSGDLVSYTKVRLRPQDDGRTRMEVRRFHGAPKASRHLVQPWLEDPSGRLRQDLERFVGYLRSQVARPRGGAFRVALGTSNRREPDGAQA